MKTQSLILAATITAGAFSGSVNAKDVTIENVLDYVVNTAVQLTTHEVQLGVQNVVANTAYMFELQSNPVGSVDITELVAKTSSEDAEVDAQSAE